MEDQRPRSRPPWRRGASAVPALLVAGAVGVLATRVYRDQTPEGRWLQAMRSVDPAERQEAAALIQVDDLDPGTVVAGLVLGTEDDAPTVRAEAAGSLARLVRSSRMPGGPDPAPALDGRARDALLALAADRDTTARATAVAALGAFVAGEADDPQVLDVLLQAMEDPDPTVRLSASDAMAESWATPPGLRSAWLAALDDPDGRVQGSAMAGLAARFRRDEAACRRIIAAAEGDDSPTRRAAREAIGTLSRGGPGPPPPPGIAPDLIALIRRRPDRIRALLDGSDPGRFDPSNLELYHEDALTSYAASLLGRIGPEARGSVPEIAAMLDRAAAKGDELLVAALADAIGRIAPDAPEAPRAVALLADRLGPEPSRTPRWQVAQALGRFGRSAEPALPALRAVADDPEADRDARDHAARAIALIESSTSSTR